VAPTCTYIAQGRLRQTMNATAAVVAINGRASDPSRRERRDSNADITSAIATNSLTSGFALRFPMGKVIWDAYLMCHLHCDTHAS
jgi:hypothetical protein